jgi:hypothetical protein
MELGRVVRYVPSVAASKEDIARQIVQKQRRGVEPADGVGVGFLREGLEPSKLSCYP